MHKVLSTLLALSAFLAADVKAIDMDNHICIAAGYYEAEGNLFMQEIARRVIAKNHLNANSHCADATKQGAEVAKRYKIPGKVVTIEDQRTIDAATHFGNAVYDSVLSRIKFD